MGEGLKLLCKLHGAITINGKRYVWDYDRNEAVTPPTLRKRIKKQKEKEAAKRDAAPRSENNG